MENILASCAIATLGALMGKEFLDWVWWHEWEDDEDERNPAPLLCATWTVWQLVEQARFWLWVRIVYFLKRWLESIRWHSPPPQPPPEPTDADGRTPEEWFVIGVVGIWNLECWYKDEYDWEVKRKWDESLKSRQLQENSETEEMASLKRGD